MQSQRLQDRVTAFTIDRNRWFRGELPEGSRLRRERDGMQCCLGFYSLACGFSEQEITGVAWPSSLASSMSGFPEQMQWLLEVRPNLRTVQTMIGDLNDQCSNAPFLKDPEREVKIAEIFAARGITVTFIN